MFNCCFSSNTVRTPQSAITRKIVSEDFAYQQQHQQVSSPGLARSPAMHEGFRTEDWVVKRATPPAGSAAPVNEDKDQDKIIVGVINLSDEEEEKDDETR